MDHIGRRKLLLISTGTITVILAIVSALLSHQGNEMRSNAGITFIFVRKLGSFVCASHADKTSLVVHGCVLFRLDAHVSHPCHDSLAIAC